MKRAFIAAATIALLGSGCALFNPYVRPAEDKAGQTPPENVKFAGGIEAAIQKADAWRRAYIKAAKTHSVTRNVTAAIILPITATGLFYGITGHGSTDRITRMALGGATLYAGNEFLTSRPRQQLYLQGARAMTCAIVASRPYLVTEKWKEEFEGRTKTFQERLNALSAAESVLTSLLSAADASKSDPGAIASAAKVAAEARKAMDDGSATKQQADLLSLRLSQSGEELEGIIRVISDRVNEEVRKTEPDLETLKNLSMGMEGLGKELAGNAWPKPPSEPAKENTQGTRTQGLAATPDDKLRAAKETVIEAQMRLAASGMALRSDIQSIANLGDVSAQLPECVPKELTIPFLVTPSDDTFQLKKGEIFVVAAEGGTGLLGYQLVGAKTDAVTITALVQKSANLVLTIKGNEKVTAGSGPILIITDDGAQKRKEIALQVE